MINIPLDLGASLTDSGIEVHGWVGDTDLPTINISWSRLVEDLFEAHVVPSRGRSILMHSGDFAYLNEVMTGLREAAYMLEEQLDQVELLED